MWSAISGVFVNIFSSISGKETLNKIDEWNLTKEETVKYQLEWLRTIPTGFQLAQRFIGIAFSIVFLIMILATFTMLAFGLEVEHLIDFINITMVKPIMIIFSLFFGGGLINSFKGALPKEKSPKKKQGV